ncbi:hypothetical protein FNF29_02079 [Cafeteria roenbergensis]|uniref:EF-hand domain-containing protein n=1 Tax=Cafeteria roenbergensis TaxID=33653 RepID=A0A5A8CPB9_CAFRO|nr:hypothetical protein FNF29_02079 [Cafeteria roenbergensis]|eukprot:KAA0154935.1 hypothetical protein FNF29_02079 [Cafeteria roenbergensis]
MAQLAREVLAVPPELKGFVVAKPALEIPKISAKAIRDTTELRLSNKGIERLCGFERFVNLEVLYLNGNKLPSLDGLEACFRIKELYADHNLLASLEGPIEDMKFLAELDVSYNKLADLDWQLETLERCQYIKSLDLRGNPCSQEVRYRQRVLAAVPSLDMLDGKEVDPVEREEARVARGRAGASSAAAGPAAAAAGVATTSGRGAAALTGRASTFGRGRSGPEASAGLAMTSGGKPLFGSGGDTLTQRRLRREAAAAVRDRRHEARKATIAAVSSAGKGKGWSEQIRKARAQGRSGGAVRSLLSRRGAGLVDDAVAGTMIQRGCAGPDLRRQGLGLLADSSRAGAVGDALQASRTQSEFERQQARATARSGSASGRASSARSGGAGFGAGLGRTGGSGGASSGAGGGDGAQWSSVRRARETVHDSTSLTDDLRGVAGARVAGSSQATASFMGAMGGALRSSRAQAHTTMDAGPQALEAARLGHARGRLGEWELLQLKKLFREADADGSGALSLDEFRTAVARAADWGFAPVDASDDGLSKQEVAQAFRALDTDGSGSVSYSEFVAVLREQARPSGPLGGAARAERASALSFTFRTLTKDEAESRARLHFKTASGLHSRLLRMPADDPKRERISLQALQLGEKGSRLLSLARRLEGAADPPERPPPRPAPRRDYQTLIQSVPEREARKTLRRGMRDYRPPPPGEESDSESDDDENKQTGADFDEFRRTVRARKPHVILRTRLDL